MPPHAVCTLPGAQSGACCRANRSQSADGRGEDWQRNEIRSEYVCACASFRACSLQSRPNACFLRPEACLPQCSRMLFDAWFHPRVAGRTGFHNRALARDSLDTACDPKLSQSGSFIVRAPTVPKQHQRSRLSFLHVPTDPNGDPSPANKKIYSSQHHPQP